MRVAAETFVTLASLLWHADTCLMTINESWYAL